MLCACVDIGTNTTRLLVAERRGGGLRQVVAARRFVRIVPGPDGAIPAETVARLAEAVAAQVRVARDHQAGQVRTVATAAIRAAPNRHELCRAVARAAGVEVEVLSGEEEAALAFAGAVAMLAEPPPDGLLGVVDVGGGSSELVAGTPDGGVSWWASLPLGLRGAHRPPPALRPAGRSTSSPRCAPRSTPSSAPSGHPRHARVRRSAAAPPRSPPRRAASSAPETLARVLSVLIAAPAADAARRLALPVERVRLLPAGLLMLEAAWVAFGRPPLRIVRGGLREGVVLRALAGRS